jgi:bifunctional N-acetylglucosamine-1-phosphate-uridyltransferase/glucosamine-1-phosphate-acetyltransferase GlmU-like protein
MFAPQEFFDLTDFDHQKIFLEDQPVWTALDRLPEYLDSFFKKPWPLSNISGQIPKTLVIHNGEVRDDLEVKPTGPKGLLQVYLKNKIIEGAAVIMAGACLFDDKILLGPGSVVEPGALIKGPAVIGKDTEVRQGAYMRGNCLVGDNCVVGHATEMKNSIMLDGAKAGHFAYVGDSILGKAANLGAGTKLANLKIIAGSIIIRVDRKRYNTKRRKLGAILGDGTETGCNSVTSPGTLMGPSSIVYAGVSVPGGYYPGRSIVIPAKECPQIR